MLSIVAGLPGSGVKAEAAGGTKGPTWKGICKPGLAGNDGIIAHTVPIEISLAGEDVGIKRSARRKRDVAALLHGSTSTQEEGEKNRAQTPFHN